MPEARTTIVVHFHAPAGQGLALRDALMPAIPHLSALPGCYGGSLYHDLDLPDTVVLIEHWESVEAHRGYIAQIEHDGTMDRLRPLLAGEPERRYLGAIKE